MVIKREVNIFIVIQSYNARRSGSRIDPPEQEEVEFDAYFVRGNGAKQIPYYLQDMLDLEQEVLDKIKEDKEEVKAMQLSED